MPYNDALIPTVEVAQVAGTPFDLRKPTPLPAGTDLDTKFGLNNAGMRPVAWLETDAPGLQAYDAARLDAAPEKGHHCMISQAHAGIAMEPQRWPDAPNHANFASITLHPDKLFRQSSFYRFILKDTP